MYTTVLVSTNYNESDCIDLKRDLQNLIVFINLSVLPDFEKTVLNVDIDRAQLTDISAHIREDKLYFWINVDLFYEDKCKRDRLFNLFMEKFTEEFNEYLCKAKEVRKIPREEHHFLDSHFYVAYSNKVFGDYSLQVTKYIILSEED